MSLEINAQKNINIQTNETASTKSTTSSNPIMNSTNIDTSNKAVKNQPTLTNIEKIIEDILKEVNSKLKANNQLSTEDLKEVLSLLPQGKIEELKTTTDAEKQKKLKDCIILGILDNTQNGKLDIQKAARRSNDYFIAIAMGFSSAQGFKKYNDNNAATKVTISERLKLQTNIKDVPKEELETKVKQFFNEIFGRTENPSKRDIKLQLQTFSRCLINSTPEEREVFLEVAKGLYQENKLPGIKAIFDSAFTKEEKEAIAHKANSDPKYYKELTCNEYPTSKEDSIAIKKILVENSNEKKLEEYNELDRETREKWLKDNKNLLESALEKQKKANISNEDLQNLFDNKLSSEEKNALIKKIGLTDEEFQVLIESRNFINAGISGQMLGIADGKFSNNTKQNILEKLNEEARKTDDDRYKEILKDIDKYVTEHKDELSTSPEKISKTLDKATNKEYSNLSNNKTENSNTTTKTNFNKKTTNISTEEMLRNLEAKKNKYYEETDEKFHIEITKIEHNELEKKSIEYLKKASINTQLNFAGSYFFTNPTVQKLVLNTINKICNNNNIVNTINLLPNNIREDIAMHFIEKFNSTDDIQKLNISGTGRNILEQEFNLLSKNKNNIS